MNTLLLLLLLSSACAATNAEEEVVEDKLNNTNHHNEVYFHKLTEGSRNSNKSNNEDPLDKLTEEVSSQVTAPTLGSVAVIVLLGFLIYLCFCHKKAPEEGFTQLENENEPSNNKRWRWRNRRYFRRNRRRNYQPNPPDAPHATSVVVQSVVTVEVPTENLHAANPTIITNAMPPAPPPYDGGINNQQYFRGNNVRKTGTNPPRQFTRY